jgi:hypothetical protein
LGWFFGQFFYDTLNFDYGVDGLRSAEKPVADLGVFDKDGKKDEMTPRKIEELKKKKDASKKIYLSRVKVRRFGEAKVGPGFPVILEVVFEDGSRETRTWDGQARWETFYFQKPAKAASARIDPENRWLLDSNLANNSIKAKASRSGVWRMTSLILFWTQNVLHVLGGLV